MKKYLSVLALLSCASIAVAAPAAQAPAPTQVGQTSSTMSGTLTSKQGKFFLMDEATRNTVEVRGEGLQKYAGQQVKVTGELVTGAVGSPDVLVVSEVSRKAAAATGKAAAAGVKAGWSKIAIIGLAGGATAATVGTLYAQDVIGGSETPVSRR